VSNPAYYSAEDVRSLLDYPGCIQSMRNAMAALSRDQREQPLRGITPVRDGKLFAIMPGMCTGQPGFGAKVISVFRDPAQQGRSAHRGIVVLFEEEAGAVVCIADAHEVTKIRTACASAVATDALARKDATTLGVLGCGTQAEAHIRAIPLVRNIQRILVWGRNPSIAAAFAERMGEETGKELVAVGDAKTLAAESEIICTVTAAPEPVLFEEWVRAGTHINAVGSSHAGPVEIEPELVAASAYFVEYRPSAWAAAAELLRARELGLIGDDHIRAEIGEVLNGDAEGRLDSTQRTIYKSLGHIVQDLEAARYIHQQAHASVRNRPVLR